MSLIALTPGSIPWLLAHELRLAFRARSKRGNSTLIIVAVVMVVLMLVAGLPLAFALRFVPIRETPGVMMILDLILLAIFTLILSQTLAGAISAFFERGDLDLLLSSPLPPRRALTVRALGIAVAPLLWFAGLVSIVVIPAAALGQVRWLTAYPVLIALAMLASAAGMSLAMALFGLIGARRARTVGQILAALIGAGFFLFGQLRNMLPDHGSQFFAGVSRWADSGVFEPRSPLSWPALAVLGHPLPLAVFAGGSALLFAAVVASLGRRFASNAGAAAGVSAGPVRSAGRQASVRGFEGGLNAALMRKELRLLLRDPALLSQVLLRVLYILPLGFAMLRGASAPHRHYPTGVAVGRPGAPHPGGRVCGRPTRRQPGLDHHFGRGRPGAPGLRAGRRRARALGQARGGDGPYRRAARPAAPGPGLVLALGRPVRRGRGRGLGRLVRADQPVVREAGPEEGFPWAADRIDPGRGGRGSVRPGLGHFRRGRRRRHGLGHRAAGGDPRDAGRGQGLGQADAGLLTFPQAWAFTRQASRKRRPLQASSKAMERTPR